ncbi:MAG: S9 family peptidase [Candidatus Heimdallarchaeaceae archaeon]
MTKEQIKISDLFKFKKILSVKFIKDKKILFEEQLMSEQENKYKSAIYLLLEGEHKPKQFTSGLTQDTSMQISPDKNKVAFLSSRGGEKEKPQIFIMLLDGGEALKFTSVSNGVNFFSWSTDGKNIVFTHKANLEEQKEEDSKKETEKESTVDEITLKLKKVEKEEKEKKKVDPRKISKIVYRRGTSYLDDRYSQIYLLDLETNEIERITSGEQDYLSPVLNKEKTKVYCLVPKVEGQLNDFYIQNLVEINLETKEERIIKEIYGFGTELTLSPDGEWIAYHCVQNLDVVSTQNQEIKIFNLDNETEKWVSKEIDNHSFSPVFDEENNYVYFISDEWEKTILYRYSIDRETLQKLYSPDAIIYSFDVEAKHGLLVMNVSSKDEPSKLLLYDFVYKRAETIWKSNSQLLSERTLSEIEEIRYKGCNDVEIQGWVVKPPDFEENKKYPLIVEIHGGPHVTWSPHERSMWFELQFLSSQGYVIFYCNPQGSSGRGYNFRYVVANWGDKPAEDILTGVDILIEKGFVDTENLFVTGGSYGGYMTAWLIGKDNRFKAAVPQRGVYNLVSFWSTTDITRFTKEEIGVYPWEDINEMWKQSPIAYVNKVKTPTRIIHSENDFRAPISQAEEYYVSLLRNEIEAEFIRYPEEGHELSRSGKPKHVKDRLIKILEWFEEHKS